MNNAIVYIWPLMSKPAQKEVELQLVEAGYTGKEKIPITDRFFGKKEYGVPLKVWRVT